MISMESPSVVMRSLTQRFIEFSSQARITQKWIRLSRTGYAHLLEFSISSGDGFCRTIAQLLFRGGRTIAGVRACRKLAGSSS
jgi:hypothetical protein